MLKDLYNESHWEHGEDWQDIRRGKQQREYMTHERACFEGWAAGIAAAGVAVSAGSAIASGVQKSDAAGALQSAAGKRPPITPAQFDTPDQAANAYLDYYNADAPFFQSVAEQQNNIANTKYQQGLNSVNPSLLSSVAKQGSVTNDLLNGQIPADVAAQVQRSSAYQALTGQGSTDSGSAHALTARDLGTTSLALQQQGSSMLSNSLANSKALNPYNTTATDLMFTPQQLLARADSNNAYSNAVLNGNQNLAYQNSLNAAAAAGYNPAYAGLTSGAGVLGSTLSGSFGQQLGNYLSNGSGGSSYVNTATGGGDLYAGGYGQSAQIANSGYYNPYLDNSLYDANGNYTGGG